MCLRNYASGPWGTTASRGPGQETGKQKQQLYLEIVGDKRGRRRAAEGCTTKFYFDDDDDDGDYGY